MTSNHDTKVHFPNPMPALFLFFVIAAATGMLVLGYLSLNPGAVGVAHTETVGDMAYRYQDFNFERPYLFVEMHDGWIIPLYRRGDVAGTLVVGDGSYLVEPNTQTKEQLERETGHDQINDTLTALYLPTTFQDFENLVYEARAEKSPSPLAIRRAQEYIDALQNTPTTVQAYGIRRDWYTNPDVVQLFGGSLGRVSYAATNVVTVTFLDMQGLELNLSADENPLSEPLTSTALNAPRFLLIYLALTILLVFLVYVLTIDAVPNDRQVLIAALRKSTERSHRTVELVIILLVGFMLEFAAMLVLVKRGLPDEGVRAWWVVAAVIAGLYAWRARASHHLVGITADNWFRAIFMGLLLGVLGFASGTLALPTGVRSFQPAVLARELVWAIVVMGYAREFFQRGLLQSYAELLAGRTWGLVVTSVLIGLAFLGPRWILQGQPLVADLVQGLVILPAYNFLLGYAFQRTGNLHANSLAAGLMVLLPRLLQF